VLADTTGPGSGARGGPLATGFTPLDTVLQGGLRPGTLTVLAGKPGRGKTITALQWARHIAASGTPVVFACF
jgi:replicative DNA helicase